MSTQPKSHFPPKNIKPPFSGNLGNSSGSGPNTLGSTVRVTKLQNGIAIYCLNSIAEFSLNHGVQGVRVVLSEMLCKEQRDRNLRPRSSPVTTARHEFLEPAALSFLASTAYCPCLDKCFGLSKQ